MGTTTKAAERKVIIDLTELLKKNADKVLSGETNLCLTTSSLSIMAINFRRHSENTVDYAENWDKKAKSKEERDLKAWQENIKTLLDFVLKVKALKIIHGSYTMKAPIQISRFRSLQVLEVKRVPIHMVEGLSKLRGQLKEITVSKSLQTLKDLLEICGGDRTPGLVWPHLKTVYLSFNSLQELDQSLNFIPFAEVLDLSHNSIAKTADCLQSLLDVMRINLGYNMLKSVPQFSSVNKLKLRTLVLRNNSLENLEGVEELCALEELDVSENFLLDHRGLQGLLSLKRLQVLCLLGNPLSYRNDHRTLTLQYIYPQAGLGVFLLDGKRLTHQETTVLQENQYRLVYDQEAASSSGNGSQLVDETDTSIAVSQLSPHGSKKKRGHRRVHSKERIPKIKDIEESLKEDYTPKSEGGSPSTSCADESEVEAQRQKDEKYYETFREHYKDDWLKALSASQISDEHSHQSASQKYEENSHHPVSQKNDEHSHQSNSSEGQTVMEQDSATRKNVKKESTVKETGSNVTDIRPKPVDKIKTKEIEQKPVVEEEIRADVHSPVTSPVSPQEFDSIRSPTSPEGVEIGENTDIYSLPVSSKKKGEKHQKRIFHMYSEDRVESPVSPQEDNKELYGAESEPHIMMLPDDEMKPLIVTTNKRFIIEKDLSGKKIAALDLKCLKGVGKTLEKCYGRDLIGGFLFTILRLDFDYVRKDMRLRRYAVESDDEAKRFESLISHYVKSKEVVVETMQCLKCNHTFDKSTQDQSEDLTKCPKCSSKQVIKSFEESVTLRAPADEPVTLRTDRRLEEKQGDEQKESKRRSWHRSTVRRSKRGRREVRGESPSDHEAGKTTAVDEVDSGQQPIIRPDSADRYNLGSSLKDYVDQMIPAPDTAKEENTQDSKDPSVGQMVAEPSTIENNSFWSDVRKFGSIKSTPRDSVSSESDITVLATNSSRSSIAAVSESIHEVLTTSSTNIEHKSWSGTDFVGDTGGKDNSSDFGTIWKKDKQGQLTPVGSPLSNSVCSSMVSSVYENTLPGNGDDNAPVEDIVKLNNTSSHQDDIVAESVPVRRSKSEKTKNRRSPNRNFTVYDQEFSQDEPDSHVSIVIEDASKMSSSRESSIYDTPCSSDITKFENTQDRSVQSIYDTATSDDNLESSHDDTAALHSHNSRRSHDRSSANQSPSSHSSPLRRKGSSRSRSSSRNSSRNRSALYIDSSVYGSEDKNNSANIPEFPSDLSPIKRTSSSRHSAKKRSALFIGNNSEISDLESQSLDLSTSSQISNPSAEVSVLSQETSAQLPWEQSDNQSAEGSRKDESLNHDEFVNIDHNIKLYLELQVLRADETAQCAVQCDIVQYMKEEAIKSLLVISTNRFMIFRIEGEGPASPDWLKSYEDQPITELRYIDIGLGYQTLRLEFETECSSYTLIIGDEGRCKKFLTLISDIVAHSDHSHLERIVKSNPMSLANLEQQVLTTEDDTKPQELVRFLMVKYSPVETSTDDIKMQSLVVTKTDLVLINENHQWPLPRLQAPLSGDIKGRQFTVFQREKINNIGTLSFNEHKPTELQLSFLETTSADSPSTWFITFETMKGVKSFVDAIREPWEEEFGVSLDITAVSFTDSSLME